MVRKTVKLTCVLEVAFASRTLSPGVHPGQ